MWSTTVKDKKALALVSAFEEEAMITYIKYPVKVSLEEEIDSDMPHFLHYKILAYALNSAGIASRDDALLAISKIAGGLPKDKQ